MTATPAPTNHTTDFSERRLTISGSPVTIRPIRHNDRMLEEKFINQLSDEAKHYRFLGGINQLSVNDLGRLCDVDYHDSMAFIAITENEGNTRELGVVQYCKSENADKHEMAITVADDYRKSELPVALMELLIAYAKLHGVKSLYSVELFDNHDMRTLATQFEMVLERDPEDVHQVMYSLTL